MPPDVKPLETCACTARANLIHLQCMSHVQPSTQSHGALRCTTKIKAAIDCY
jgi:hypothetical protein